MRSARAAFPGWEFRARRFALSEYGRSVRPSRLTAQGFGRPRRSQRSASLGNSHCTTLDQLPFGMENWLQP